MLKGAIRDRNAGARPDSVTRFGRLAWLLAGLLVVVPAFAANDAIHLDGRFTQGGLVLGEVPPGSRVSSDGQPVRVSPEGRFVIGFHRDAAPASELRVEFPDGREEVRQLAVAPRDYEIQRIDGLPKRQVEPSAEDLKRIRQEAAMAREARKLDDDRTDFWDGFVWPVEGPITGVYGSQRILNGEPRRPHFGVDIARPVGTPVRAPADGVITLAHPDMFFSGGTLALDHGHGLSSWFLHLSRILVKQGDRVKRAT